MKFSALERFDGGLDDCLLFEFLPQNFGKRANSQLDRARAALSDAAHDTHENLRDNVVVSLVLAAGVGLFVGYLIGRSSDRDL